MVIFTSGFIDSITITTNNISKPTEKIIANKTEKGSFSDEKDSMDILVLGDSIGSGAGDEGGKDIGRRYGELIDDNDKVKVINLSISGSKSKDLMEQVNDANYDEIIKNSDMIIIAIGGNDLKEILDSSALDLFVDYDNILSSFLSNLESIIGVLKEKNSTSQIVYIGLYNPYGETLSQEKLDLLINWNYETQRLIDTDEQMVYIPTYDLFKYNLQSYLSIDEFHPSAMGYEAVAKRLYNVMNGVK
jgi:lysophospholipase L1-like esterase